ncbi:MAG: hypothetical protein AAF372_01760, partial [Pseudomonadota bacterium]
SIFIVKNAAGEVWIRSDMPNTAAKVWIRLPRVSPNAVGKPALGPWLKAWAVKKIMSGPGAIVNRNDAEMK